MMAMTMLAVPVLAQDIPPASERPADFDNRYALAQQVEQFRPVSERIDEMLGTLSLQLSGEDRAQFRINIMGAIDARRLEQLSVTTMAQLFTPEELQSMISYYNDPHSRAISEKSPLYRQVIDAEISREIQTALNNLVEPPAPEAAEPPATIVPPAGDNTTPDTQ